MMYKGSLILQHSELKIEPKQTTVSTALEREGNSNMGKKITCSQTNWGGGGAGRKKERKGKSSNQNTSSWCSGTRKDFGSTITGSVA